MDLKLQDKLALVSGSTQGIGLAIVKALAGEGARVILNGRSQASVSRALEHQQRERRANPGGDDPLRHDQDRPNRRRAGLGDERGVGSGAISPFH